MFISIFEAREVIDQADTLEKAQVAVEKAAANYGSALAMHPRNEWGIDKWRGLLDDAWAKYRELS